MMASLPTNHGASIEIGAPGQRVHARRSSSRKGHLADPLPPTHRRPIAEVALCFVGTDGGRLADQLQHLARDRRLPLEAEDAPDDPHDACDPPGHPKGNGLVVRLDALRSKQVARRLRIGAQYKFERRFSEIRTD